LQVFAFRLLLIFLGNWEGNNAATDQKDA